MNDGSKDPTVGWVSFRRLPFSFATLRRLQILVDGRRQLMLSRKQEAAVIVAPGRHSVRSKMDWCTSPELIIDVAPGETVAIDCGAQSFWPALIVMIIRPGSVFTLSKRLPEIDAD